MRDSISCAGHQYTRTAHVQGYNLERFVGAGEDYDDLGMSTQGGEAIQVELQGNSVGPRGGVTTYPIDRVYMVIVSSVKVELRTGSCRVLS